MNKKQIVALVVAFAGLGISQWKGPGAWAAFAAAVTALCLFALPLLARLGQTNPTAAAADEYVQDLEDELEKVNSPKLAAIRVKHGVKP